ncbi:MAG TPA: argininosuccinate lyase [bacterium]|nr:argininosuccinate lyase [bacterium]HOL35673.1 argininosuccinate lyase [bacterium]HPP07516.1 argininosuccinate lyase [bacterium]
MKYIWSGRLKKDLHHLVRQFTFSIEIDKKMALFDVLGSIVHAEMLVTQKIISRQDGHRIISGLKKIQNEIKTDSFVFMPDDEDIHTAVERRLTELIGPCAGKLHTARSRNDQIVLDEKLYLKHIIPEMIASIVCFQKNLVKKAEECLGIYMPEFTHFQPAQPVLFAHHLLAYVTMCERDKDRFIDALKRINVSPLGACACVGTSFNIDPDYVAEKLNFETIFSNSIDAVSDRDFIIETISAIGILMVHLSRISEEFIIWHSPLIGFVDLPEEFCTGSSIMPQKKNPDVLELIRGKTSTVIGNLTGIFTLIKGLPLSYNRDLQEDKRFLFESCEISAVSLAILTEIIEKTKINANRMKESCKVGYIEATDIAEYLVTRGTPFRQAHHLVGKLVGIAAERNLPMAEIDEETLKMMGCDTETIHFIKTLDSQKSISLKKSKGGTGINQVKQEIKKWKSILK